MTDDLGEKTEQPTENRRRTARRLGQVPRSADLNAAILMLTVSGAIWLLGVPTSESLARWTAGQLSGDAWRDFRPQAVIDEFRVIASLLGMTVLPILAVFMLSAGVSNVLQVGFLFAPEAIQPKLSRISPGSGLTRLFSWQSLANMMISLGKLSVIIALAWWFISATLPIFLAISEHSWASTDSPESGSFRERSIANLLFSQLHGGLAEFAFWLAVVFLGLALLDLVVRRWQHEVSLRMSREELREEMKKLEGDPQLRVHRREVYRKVIEARGIDRTRDAVDRNPISGSFPRVAEVESLESKKTITR